MGAGQTIERGLELHDYNARHYAHPLGRWIAPDTIVPEPGNPQSLNRYSYVLNNPPKSTDPSGHIPCESCVGVGGGGSVDAAFAAAASAALTVSQHPEWMQALQRLLRFAPYAPVLPAAVDPANNPVQTLQSLGGNTAGPGGLDPNNWDPSRWGTNYRENYEKYYGVERDSAYQVHHVLPRRFGEILSKASQGRINVNDPHWLREVLKNDPTTGTAVHQRLYTDVWQNWAQQLGRDPTAQEIIQFAKQLEAQYATQGTLFYREGINLAGRIDWNTLLQLLQGGVP